MEEDKENHCSIDLDWIKTIDQITFLNKLLFNQKNLEQVNFMFQHHGIYNYLKQKKNIRLYNFDHHHDFFYSPEHEGHEKVDQANWVHYLIQHDSVSEYHWIKNIDSEWQTYAPIIPFLKKDFVYLIYDEYHEFKDLQFKSVSICLSPEFTARNSQDIYQVYMDYFKHIGVPVQIHRVSKEFHKSLIPQ